MNRYFAPMIALALFVGGGIIYWIQTPADVVLATANVKPVRAFEMRAVIASVSGDVLMSKDGNSWSKAEQGLPLKKNYQVRTGDGRAAVTFAGAGTLRLERHTLVEIGEISEKEIRVRNADGRVYSSVNDLPGLTWRVDALETSVTSAGTAFAVAADPAARRVTVQAIKHALSLKIAPSEGADIAIVEGQQAEVALARPASEAVLLSPLSGTDADDFLKWNADLDGTGRPETNGGTGEAAPGAGTGVGALRASTSPLP